MLLDSRVFHSLYKVGRNGSIGIKGFNNSKQKLPPVEELDLMQEIVNDLREHIVIPMFVDFLKKSVSHAKGRLVSKGA